ncbi:MAG: hypothetical protein HY800_01220 [Ignavibacteriales bacterium]|nr:hypothetical protein [Ignavibacteriales bacterium]
MIIMTTLGTSKAISQSDTSDTAIREKLFDTLYSSKDLGCTVKKEGTTFRLFAPRATQVFLVLFNNHDDKKGEEIRMVRDENGVWEYYSFGRLYGRYYGYRIEGPIGHGEKFDSSVVIGDPYSKAVVTKNNFHHQAKTFILNTEYNWEGDTFIAPANHDELIIYEAHVRDLTAHQSSEVGARGTYLGLIEKGKTGGLSYIAVIMDVVYNHVSQYDYNPFKYIDKFYYCHTDTAGNFLKASGCGNDFYTSRPMSRRLIVESIKYWMKEYHIDGFRFDIATMIDWKTCNEIANEAKKINPNVILIAEAWGGGKYDPPGFSDIGWASWNDRFRNGVKGQNPYSDAGFVFGRFQDKNTKQSVMGFVTGTLREDGGMYLKKEHSVNYLESHDDLTMGDFIRIATGSTTESSRVSNMDQHVKLTPVQLALSKLAAMFLFISQGPVMIHEGQEFARSKVIAPTNVPDPRIGMIDHNSYDKDNETNYLNYYHRELNRELFDYYKGLIELRKQHPIFSSAPKEAVEFLKTDDDFVVAFRLNAKKAKSISTKNSFIVILNGNPTKKAEVVLPKGTWKIIANDKKISLKKPLAVISKSAPLQPTSGMILMSE